MKEYQPSDSFIRTATACPEVSIADVNTNVENILNIYKQACEQRAALVVFPELSITGYTVGDLVQQTSLLDQARTGLVALAEKTVDCNTAIVVGLPLQVGNSLYSCAAVLADGQIKGVIPKSNLPTYNEFYEQRWFQTWDDETCAIEIGESKVLFGSDLIFNIDGVEMGIEICEDLWIHQPPSARLVEKGALLIANPSASPEQVGKSAYRRDLVRMQSARLFAGYVYAGCDTSESTAEVVMSGHQLIAASGQIEAEKAPFDRQELLVADIDVDHLKFDRRKQHLGNGIGSMAIETTIVRTQEDIKTTVDRNPFLPNESEAARHERLGQTVQIQAHGLAQRMRATKQDQLVLGLSGGLDSTLAFMVAIEAAAILGKEPSDILQTLTMPGPASSDDTQSNAQQLAYGLRVPNKTIPISDLVEKELAAIGHDGETQDVTYENVQARARSNLLFNYANHTGSMVLGTGDLSEIALGWCTYNADQQSHYNVNGTVPKTLVRHLVGHLAQLPKYRKTKPIIESILGTVISPELTKARGDGISQKTEDIIGPYELHDFFLYYLVRWGDTPQKISYLAQKAFEDSYTQQEIAKWLEVFIDRFTKSQFKRDNLPNSPKVGSVSLSPRGDWRMPSDLRNSALWQ